MQSIVNVGVHEHCQIIMRGIDMLILEESYICLTHAVNGIMAHVQGPQLVLRKLVLVDLGDKHRYRLARCRP